MKYLKTFENNKNTENKIKEWFETTFDCDVRHVDRDGDDEEYYNVGIKRYTTNDLAELINDLKDFKDKCKEHDLYYEMGEIQFISSDGLENLYHTDFNVAIDDILTKVEGKNLGLL